MGYAIFGAGTVGKGIKKGLEKYYGIHICKIFDNDENKWGEKIDDVIIFPPQKLVDIDLEKVFICIGRVSWYRAVERQLIDMGIPREKIVIMVLSREYEDAFIEHDPIRINWIKAFSEYTKESGISGSVAECGVFLGNTALFINKYWPDRTLHLFDTFDGFDDKDIANEMNSVLESKKSETAAIISECDSLFKDHAVPLDEIVKGRMRYPNNLERFSK